MATRPDPARLVGPTVLVLVMGAATHSVVRYRPAIVAAYLGAAALLLWHLRRSPEGRPGVGTVAWTRAGWAIGLAVAGLVTWWVPGFTYLDPGPATAVRAGFALTALAAAAVVLLLPARPGAPPAVALVGYLAAGWVLLHRDPAPAIDVWYTLQGAADALAAGRDVYREVWLGPPGVMAAFTYLPATAVVLAPGRWLAGDVRYALIVVTVLAALAAWRLPRTGWVRRPAASPAQDGPGHAAETTSDTTAAGAAAALLLLLPGTATQVEQAWTEPLLLACLAAAALAWRRGWGAAAILALALGLASKQHLVLLLPLLAAWPRFGLRRAVATGATAAVLVAPWLLTDLRGFLDDTVALLVRYPEMRFADTVYVLVLNEWGVLLPFWVTGAIVLGTVGAVALTVRRRDPDPGTWLRWAALVLLVATLVNKQGFYNQYWLVAAMVVLSWAWPVTDTGRALDRSPEPADTTRPEPSTSPSTSPSTRPAGTPSATRA